MANYKPYNENEEKLKKLTREDIKKEVKREAIPAFAVIAIYEIIFILITLGYISVRSAYTNFFFYFFLVIIMIFMLAPIFAFSKYFVLIFNKFDIIKDKIYYIEHGHSRTYRIAKRIRYREYSEVTFEKSGKIKINAAYGEKLSEGEEIYIVKSRFAGRALSFYKCREYEYEEED